MATKYHVNPSTGNVSTCRASKALCPFGGASGTENHYGTPAEAQNAAEQLMDAQYGVTSAAKKGDAPQGGIKSIIGKEFSPVHASELFDLDKLRSHVDNGLVYARRHHELPLTVYKYSEMTTYQKAWDEVTMRTRGLILDDDGNVVARPFDKFFNYSQLESVGLSVDPDENGVIMDKMDGSMGTAFRYQGQWHVATQGSFHSAQADHATQMFRARYADMEVPENVTLLGEIVYPENRVVTNYGDRDEFVLLAGMSHDGQWQHPESIGYEGSTVPMRAGSVRDALNSPDPGDFSEGFVIRTDSGDMVKIKYPSYLSAHQARFSITPLNVWRNLSEGTFNENMLVIPDEFNGEVKAHETILVNQFNETAERIDAWGDQIPEGDRGTRAKWVQQNVEGDVKSLVMSKFIGGSDVTESIWKSIRPKGA